MPTVSEVFTIESPWESANKARATLGIKPAERLLFVSIAKQTMQFFRKGILVRSFVISTSKRPPSNVKNSLGTPRGHHEIAERIGAGQPPGMVFKARVCTGHHFSELSAETENTNLITSRILWLEGLEPGVNRGGNVDSHARYIYIHGTGDEPTIGRPASCGCVHLAADDLIPLFDRLPSGTLVWIAER